VVVLDCDGVILNSNSAYEHMYDILFRKYGVKMKARDIYAHFGESPMHILHVVFKGRNIKPIFRDYKLQLKNNKFNGKIKANPGARKAIARLSKNYRVVVASGALRLRLTNSMKRFRLMNYFEFILGSDDVRRAKPAPDMLIKIMKRLHARKRDVIFVGDAPNDLISARRAGVKFIAVLSGVLDRKTAKKMKADYIVADITKVQALLEKIGF
jgi:HAD superfamily hydrolase (TIGR01549 family)